MAGDVLKKRKPITQKQFVINQLRRSSYRWGPRNQALAAARVERGFYTCVMCPPHMVHPKKFVKLDHINPVVPVTGWDNWDGYISRMFCEAEGFQVLCKTHHDEKTKQENIARKNVNLQPKALFKKKKKRRKK